MTRQFGQTKPICVRFEGVLTLRPEQSSGPNLDQGEVHTTTRTYETLYIDDPNLNDQQVEEIISKYSGIIAEQGGKVTAAGKWDKRRLAYEIKHYKEGIYILMFFEGGPAVAKELNRVMRISDDVIRHVILRVEPKHVDTTRIEKPAEPPVEIGVGELAEEDVEPVAEETAEEAAEIEPSAREEQVASTEAPESELKEVEESVEESEAPTEPEAEENAN